MVNSTLLPTLNSRANSKKTSNDAKNYDIVASNKYLENMNSISETPQFHFNFNRNIELSTDTKKAFKNMALRVAIKQERTKEVLLKADRLGIPYIPEIAISPLFDKFATQVERYEELLDECDERGIEYDLDAYDPADLNNKIEEHDHDQYVNKLNDSRDYFAARSILEV